MIMYEVSSSVILQRERRGIRGHSLSKRRSGEEGLVLTGYRLPRQIEFGDVM